MYVICSGVNWVISGMSYKLNLWEQVPRKMQLQTWIAPKMSIKYEVFKDYAPTIEDLWMIFQALFLGLFLNSLKLIKNFCRQK